MAVGRDVTGPRRSASPAADRLPRPAPRCYTGGMRHRRRLAVGLVLVLWVLPGCSGDDPPLRPPAAARHRGAAPRRSRPSRKGRLWTGPLRCLPWTRHRLPGRRSPCARRSTSPPPSPGAPRRRPRRSGHPTAAPTSCSARRIPTCRTTSPPSPAPTRGYAVTGSVPIPRLRPVWDVHLLANGTVLVSGQFRGDRPGYGFLSVDPARGKVRRADVIPFEEGTELASGSSVLSPDGETITLFLSSFTDGRQLDLLMSADASSGRIRGGRDLSEEVRAVSETGVGPWSTWLFARPDGGVDLVFDAYPRGRRHRRRPDAAPLRPRPGAGGRPGPGGRRRGRRTAPGGGGRPGRHGLRPRPGARRVAADRAVPRPARRARVGWTSPDRPTTRSWSIRRRAGRWCPPEGASGWSTWPRGASTPVDVGCAPGVDQLLPGPVAGSALMLGRCGPRGGQIPTLWITGPAP